MPETKKTTPAAQAQQDMTQTSDAKAEATGTAKATGELSNDDLAAVAGGARSKARN
jgi:hypothetical protein